MNGSDITRGVASGIAMLVIIAFVTGGALAIGGYFLISWLVSHVSIGWA